MTIPPLLIQTATTNLFANPVLATNTDGWAAGNGTGTRVSAEPGSASGAAHAYRYVASGTSGANVQMNFTPLTGATAGRAITASVDVWVPPALNGRTFYLYIHEAGGASAAQSSWSTTPLSLGWNRLTHTRTLVRNDRSRVDVYVEAGGAARLVGDTYDVTGAQVEESDRATPFTIGTRAAKRLPGFLHVGSQQRIGPLRVGKA